MSIIKFFNDFTNILFDIYYPITNLLLDFIIESVNIIGAFDECITQSIN